MSARPKVEATLTTASGVEVQFLLDADGTYQQWGAATADLGETVEAVEQMAEAFAEYAAERHCDTCGEYVDSADDLPACEDLHAGRHCSDCETDCPSCQTAKQGSYS